MTNRSDLVREVERALTRAPENSPSGRYAVYVPGAVVIGTYTRKGRGPRSGDPLDGVGAGRGRRRSGRRRRAGPR